MRTTQNTFAPTEGVRPRSSLPLLPGLEFLDAVVGNCLQWLPSSRPTAACLLQVFSMNAQQPDSFMQLETPASTTSVGLAHRPTAQLWQQPSHTGGTGDATATAAHSSTGSNATPSDTGAAEDATRRKAADQSDQRVTQRLSKTSQVHPTSPSTHAQAGDPRGNPRYGRCEIQDCTNYKVRKHIYTCWSHREKLLPSEMVIAKALQKENLLTELFPCDLVSCVALAARCEDLYGGLLPFAVVSALKIPSASLTFVTELESNKQEAARFVAALDLAPSPQCSTTLRSVSVTVSVCVCCYHL